MPPARGPPDPGRLADEERCDVDGFEWLPLEEDAFLWLAPAKGKQGAVLGLYAHAEPEQTRKLTYRTLPRPDDAVLADKALAELRTLGNQVR